MQNRASAASCTPPCAATTQPFGTGGACAVRELHRAQSWRACGAERSRGPAGPADAFAPHTGVAARSPAGGAFFFVARDSAARPHAARRAAAAGAHDRHTTSFEQYCALLHRPHFIILWALSPHRSQHGCARSAMLAVAGRRAARARGRWALRSNGSPCSVQRWDDAGTISPKRY